MYMQYYTSPIDKFQSKSTIIDIVKYFSESSQPLGKHNRYIYKNLLKKSRCLENILSTNNTIFFNNYIDINMENM